MTPVQKLIKEITKEEKSLTESYDIFLEILEEEREQYLDMLVEFQIFMNENDYISDYDWDFERMAIKFLNSKAKPPHGK